jgi:hypothetical protein
MDLATDNSSKVKNAFNHIAEKGAELLFPTTKKKIISCIILATYILILIIALYFLYPFIMKWIVSLAIIKWIVSIINNGHQFFFL